MKNEFIILASSKIVKVKLQFHSDTTQRFKNDDILLLNLKLR